jgi:hypothetical protein
MYMSSSYHTTAKHAFQERNALGVPGHVFGRHWHQRKGPKVPSWHPEFRHEVRIRWAKYEGEMAFGLEDGPLILPHDVHWGMFHSKLSTAEECSGFPIREHCGGLVARNPGAKPVILEWGCGAGEAVKELTADPQIKGKVLVFGYGDTWDVCWNEARGVKFLFFVKEHLAEYFRRARLKIDFIFTHGGLETMLHGDELPTHLRDLASVMATGGMIVLPTHGSSIINRFATPPSENVAALQDLFRIECWPADGEAKSHILIRK